MSTQNENHGPAQTRAQLHDWARTQETAAAARIHEAADSPHAQRRLEARQERHDYVMNYDDPSYRLMAAGAAISEMLGWNHGRGHLLATGPGLPVKALDALAVLDLPPADIEAAIASRIDPDGNLTTADIVAAAAELTGVPGTEDAYLQYTHEQATSHEALRCAEDAAYQDEATRLDELPLSDLLAEVGHPDLDTALQAVAERHGHATTTDLETVLYGDRTDERHSTYEALSVADRALLYAADTDDSAPDSTAAGWADDDADEL